MSAAGALTGASWLCALWASFLGIREVWAKRWHPVVWSWVIWAALMAEGARAASGWPAISYGYLCAAACAVIAWRALLIPRREREQPARIPGTSWRLDYACSAGAVAGLVMLLRLHDPAAVVLVTVVTDALAYIPVLANCWRDPQHEDPRVYGLYGIGAFAGLVAVRATPGLALTLTSAAYLTYLTLFDCGAAVLVITRRRAQRPEPRHARQMTHH